MSEGEGPMWRRSKVVAAAAERAEDMEEPFAPSVACA